MINTNLPEKRNFLPESYKPTKAIDKRREMLKIREVANGLSTMEQSVFVASTKKQICEISDTDLLVRLAEMLRFIARDAGIKKPLDEYDATKAMSILKTYYPFLTLADVSLAFEMAMAGKLDEYLPRDKDGNPDKNHYQQFNVEYLTKILNAFKRKQSEVLTKAFALLPKHEEISEDEIRYLNHKANQTIVNIFLRYKYRGVLNLGLSGNSNIYNFLLSAGLADPVEENDEDKRKAIQSILHRAAMGLVNSFTADCVRFSGRKHPQVIEESFLIGRENEIRKAFDRMIKNELQINSYL